MIRERLRLSANEEAAMVMNEIVSGLGNLSRNGFRSMLDGKRDLNAECSYPEKITLEDYKEMYDRESIAARVVNVYPDECWSMHPEVYESEDPNTKTRFEREWDKLLTRHKIFHYLHRIDRLCGIGHFGVIFIGTKDGKDLKQPADLTKTFGANELSFVRVFDQTQVKVQSMTNNRKSERNGQPEMYAVTFLDPGQLSGDTVIDSTVGQEEEVHWSRIIHVADNCESNELFGKPRQTSVYNRLIDIRKILGADGEGYYKGGFPGLSIETQSNLDSDIEEEEELRAKEDMEKYQLGLKRYLFLVGLTAKSLAPQVTDPTNHFMTQVQAICIALGIPLRVFMGSEEAKLASTQDIRTWNRRLSQRQNEFVSNMIIRAFIDRLILMGILPEPVSSEYHIYWSDLNSLSKQDRAVSAAKMTDALYNYIAGGLDALVPPLQYLTLVLGFDEGEAKQIVKSVIGSDDDTKKIREQIKKIREQLRPQQSVSGRIAGKSSGRSRQRSASGGKRQNT